VSGLLVSPVCDCGSRDHHLRFDTDVHVGAIICSTCGNVLMSVSVLANRDLDVIKDPVAGELPEGILYELEKEGRLPPVARGDQS
jgi:hypothetical protein